MDLLDGSRQFLVAAEDRCAIEMRKTILIWPSRTHAVPICRFIVIRGGLSHKPGGLLTCDQALPLSLITRGEEVVKHSFDGSHVKRTDSDLFPDWLGNSTPKLALL